MVDSHDDFNNIYSDDIEFIHDVIRSAETNLLNSWPNKIYESSRCRVELLILFGSIEAYLKFSIHKYNISDFDILFNNKVSNSDKIEKMKSIFRGCGVSIDDDVLSDYLAIKYIRNRYVHAQTYKRQSNPNEWEKKQTNYIKERGFPISVKSWGNKELQKIRWVAQNFYMYVTAANHLKDKGYIAKKDVSMSLPFDRFEIREIDFVPGPLDISKIHFTAIGGLGSVLRNEVERLSILPDTYWNKGIEDPNKLSTDKKLLLIHQSARLSVEKEKSHNKHNLERFEKLSYNWGCYLDGIGGIQRLKAISEATNFDRSDTDIIDTKKSSEFVESYKDLNEILPNMTPLIAFCSALSLDTVSSARWYKYATELIPFYELKHRMYGVLENQIAGQNPSEKYKTILTELRNQK